MGKAYPNDQRRRRTVQLLVVGVVVLALGAVLMPRVLLKMADFEVYRLAAGRFAAAEPLYRVEDGHYQHKYLPIFAGLMLPLTWLSPGAGKIAWYWVSIAAVVGLVGTSLSLLPRRGPATAVILVCTVLAMLKFYAHELSLGQCNALMALCVVVGFALVAHGRPVLAGGALALAVVIKPYPVIFLPYFLLKKRLTIFGVFVALVVVSLLLPALVYGQTGNVRLLESWTQVLSRSTPTDLLNQDNVSIWAMYAKWLGRGPLAVALACVSLAGIAASIVALVRRATDVPHAEYLEMAALLLLIPLCSPQGWDYGLLAATPAVMLLISTRGDQPPGMQAVVVAALVTMGLSVFDLMGRKAYAAFMATSAITVCALVLLGSLAYLRVHRLA